MHTIKPYSTLLELFDYDGTPVEIKLNKAYPTVPMISNALFTKSKKAKQKASHLHIEKDSLGSKIEHIKLFIHTVQESKDVAKILFLFPKKSTNEENKSK